MTNAVLTTPSFAQEVQEILNERKPSVYRNIRINKMANHENTVLVAFTDLAGKEFHIGAPVSNYASDIADSIQTAHLHILFRHRFKKIMIAEYGEEVFEATDIEFESSYVIIGIENNGLRTTYLHHNVNPVRPNVMDCIKNVHVIYNALGNATSIV